MAIARKPQPQETTDATRHVDIEALINKGGSVGGDTGSPAPTLPSPATATVNLRLPADFMARIDQTLKRRPLRTPRHTWLLEAVLEKLEREETAAPAP